MIRSSNSGPRRKRTVVHPDGSVYSHHAANELVDLLLAVAPDAALLEGVALLLKATEWGAQLEGPQEVVGLLEVGSASPDLVDEVLDAVDANITESTGNDGVVVEGNTGAVDLSVASLVDESADVVAGWVSVGDVWLDKSDHVDGGTVQLDEDTVVELSQAEELHDLLLLGWELVDTKRTAVSYTHLTLPTIYSV